VEPLPASPSRRPEGKPSVRTGQNHQNAILTKSSQQHQAYAVQQLEAWPTCGSAKKSLRGCGKR
jgi:hypothetical protein